VGKNNSKQKRHAMWLIAHIRAIGAEPLPFAHQSYRSYLAALQLQYDTTRAGMDKESRRQARLAARALMRRHTLNGFAPDVMPLKLTSSVVPSKEPAEVHRSPSTGNTLDTASLSSRNTLHTKRTARDIENCKRKLRHTNYLSALFHLVSLGDVGLHAYPCEFCDGIHVGHHPDRVRLRVVNEELASIAAGLEALAVERRHLEERKTSLVALREKLLDDIFPN
jgi:hypothetical protein